MPLSRRLFLAAPALMLVPRAALAGAVCKPVDLSKGIAFRRQDGTTGLARREGDGTVVIDYVTNRGNRTDRRRSRMGIYETDRILDSSEEPVVGSAPPEFVQKFSARGPEPDSGQSWKTRVRQTRIDIGYGDYMKEVRSESHSAWQAEFRFLDGSEVKISGCYHLILPVEATFTSGKETRRQRWIYFPQLGFGIETGRDGVANGIVAMTPA